MNIKDLHEAGKCIRVLMVKIANDSDVLIATPRLGAAIGELGHLMERFAFDLIEAKTKDSYLDESSEDYMLQVFKKAFTVKSKVKNYNLLSDDMYE